jgi:hypothetical protein
MKVIITKNFWKKYLKNLSKYFSKDEFVRFLKKRNHTFIWLHYPYFKIKWYIKMVNIRWVLFLLEDDSIIPLMIFLKKDKKYWENINWSICEDDILIEYEKTLEDIKSKNYEEF